MGSHQQTTGTGGAPDTLGAHLERQRLDARERRLERVVTRLRELARAREAARLSHEGISRAAADFAAELEIVRRRLRLLGDDEDRPATS